MIDLKSKGILTGSILLDVFQTSLCLQQVSNFLKKVLEKLKLKTELEGYSLSTPQDAVEAEFRHKTGYTTGQIGNPLQGYSKDKQLFNPMGNLRKLFDRTHIFCYNPETHKRENANSVQKGGAGIEPGATLLGGTSANLYTTVPPVVYGCVSWRRNH